MKTDPIKEYHAIANTLHGDELHSLNAYLIGSLLVLMTPKMWESAISTVKELMNLSLPAVDALVETGSMGEFPDVCSEELDSSEG